FFFQAEDGIRGFHVTGVQTCALPIWAQRDTLQGREHVMKGLRSILFVSQGLGNETNALRQALYVARDNGAELKVLVVCPELPREMEDYRDKYESALAAQVESSLRAAEQALGPGGGVRASVDVESGATPAVRIIRRVLRDAHDMVVKEAEPEDGGKGFRALDMELLRKCPCPVFLCRSVEKRKE